MQNKAKQNYSDVVTVYDWIEQCFTSPFMPLSQETRRLILQCS